MEEAEIKNLIAALLIDSEGILEIMKKQDDICEFMKSKLSDNAYRVFVESFNTYKKDNEVRLDEATKILKLFEGG